jgi:hypothetical protein
MSLYEKLCAENASLPASTWDDMPALMMVTPEELGAMADQYPEAVPLTLEEVKMLRETWEQTPGEQPLQKK